MSSIGIGIGGPAAFCSHGNWGTRSPRTGRNICTWASNHGSISTENALLNPACKKPNEEADALVFLVYTAVIHEVPFLCDMGIASGRLNGDKKKVVSLVRQFGVGAQE